MAVREIKTTIALDGEQKFKQAIAAVNQSLRVSETEMKAVTAAYKESGDEATYMAEKQRVLGEQIESQKSKISMLEGMLDKAKAAYEQAGNTLDEYRRKLEAAEKSADANATKELAAAVERAEKAYFDAGKKVNDYKIQLNNARANMSQLRTNTDKADRSVEELGRDSIKAGRQLEQGIGEGAEEAERDVKSLIRTMQEDISSIRTSSAVNAITGLWNTATSAFSSVEGFVSGTAELRRQMSFLAQNAQTQGFDFEFIKGQLTEVTTLTGDTSASIEAVSNLMAVPGMKAENLTSTVDLLAGAVVSFPDTVKFESLADSLQETLATGQATGQFAELLSRLGVDVNEFNEALENSETEAGDLNIAMAYLATAGMSQVYEQWQKNNQAMIDASETQSELESELAEFGGTLENYIVTPVKELLVEALKWVNDELAILDQWNADKTGKSGEVDPFGLSDTTYYKDPLDIQSVEDLNKLAEMAGGKKKYTGFQAAANTGQKGAPTLEQQLTDFLMQDLDMSMFTPQEATSTSLLGKWKQDILDTQEALKEAEPDLKESGEEAGNALVDGAETALGKLAGRAKIFGQDAGLYFGSGLLSQVSYVAMASAQLAAAAASRLTSGSAISGLKRPTEIVLQVDGRSFARGLLPYQDEAMAVNVD